MNIRERYTCNEDAIRVNLEKYLDKSKYIIYPYGKWGKYVETILNEKGIKDYYVVDQNFDANNPRMISLDEAIKKEGYFWLLANDGVMYYMELRNVILNNVKLDNVADLCFENTLFEIRKYQRGDARVATLENCAREIRERNVAGNVAEAGVYQGGFAAYINKLFPNRKLYLFDTFEGFNEQDSAIELKNGFSGASQDWGETSEEIVLSKMIRPENCIIKKGFFPETAADIKKDETFCFVSLDMDLYQPIYEGLKFFYPRLSKGGYIFVHDCRNLGYLGSRQALLDFCEEMSVGYVLLQDEWGSAVITK